LSASEHRPLRLALTIGDPAGIGPEVAVKALFGGRLSAEARLLVVGSRRVLEHEAVALGFDPALLGERCEIVDLDNFTPGQPGRRAPSGASGRASVQYIERAVRMVLDGEADALVTCPISKEAIAAGGSEFPGHTEMLASLTGAGDVLMVLIGSELRVALVTRHVALRDVAALLRAADITRTAALFDEGLRRYFAIDEPRLAVCGLNPHCGDGGRFGDEEARTIAPAVEQARADGIRLDGPLPADSVFARAAGGAFDGVLALYHDQGMIPVKFNGVHSVVNITFGLPIIRTSVGHGTAFDIAGQGCADESSLLEAIAVATRMVRAGRAG
jgi:4-hydroxythreonine-4-phosphate dehydrogenase